MSVQEDIDGCQIMISRAEAQKAKAKLDEIKNRDTHIKRIPVRVNSRTVIMVREGASQETINKMIERMNES